TGVSRLAPGEQLVVRDGRLRTRALWAAGPFGAPRANMEPAIAARSVADTLRVAVERQLVADVPVGALLSGGLDSSAIVACGRAPLARRGSVANGGVWARRAAKAFAHADQSADARLLGYFGWGEPEWLRGLFAREHIHRLTLEALHAPMLEFLARLPPGLLPL